MSPRAPEKTSEFRNHNKWKHRLERFRENGMRYVIQRIKTRLHTYYRERQLGISTCGFIPSDELCEDEQNHDYDPTSYQLLDRVLKYVQETVSEPYIVDFGAGKGRTVAVAGTFPFKRIVGIEYHEALAASARKNLNRAGAKMKCGKIDIYQQNAQDWIFPEEANVIFMFNPFSGDVMETVLGNIQDSLTTNPRDLCFIFIYPHRLIQNPLRETSWLELKEEMDTGAEEHLRCLIYTATGSN